MSKNSKVNLNDYTTLSEVEINEIAKDLLGMPLLDSYIKSGLILQSAVTHLVLVHDLRSLIDSLERITDAYEVAGKKYNYETRNVQVIWKKKKGLLGLLDEITKPT